MTVKLLGFQWMLHSECILWLEKTETLKGDAKKTGVHK